MKKKIITVDISAKELKKKLDIKDGYTPIKGVDYFDGENGKDAIVDTENIAQEASKLALQSIKPSIPTIEQIEKDIPKLGQPIRDSLELLQGSERLDKKAILGLEDYDEIAKLAREPKVENHYSGGGGVRNFIELYDTPSTYSGQAGKVATVKGDETGLEFADATGGDRYKTTSTTTQTIVPNGNLTFTVDSGLAYTALQDVIIAYDSNNHMHGEVVSYSGTTLVVDIQHKTGSGTYSSWTINLDGIPVDAISGSGTVNEIAYFTNDKVIASLPTSNYPSLTELSYVKGVTSAIQTQLDGKQASGTYVTGATNSTLTLTGTTLGLNLGNANTWTGQQTFSTSAIGTNNTIFSAIASQTADLQRWNNSSGTQIGGITKDGFVKSSVYRTMGNVSGMIRGDSFFEFQSVTGSTLYWDIRNDGQARFFKGMAVSGTMEVYSSAINFRSNGIISRDGLSTDAKLGVLPSYIYTYTAGTGQTAMKNFSIAGQTADIEQWVAGLYGSTVMASVGATGQWRNRLVTTQQQWEYDASNYANITVGSTGGTVFDAVGSGASFTFSDDIILADAKNIQANTTTGTKIGTATTQKLSLWNATPIVQPTTAITASTFTANTSGIVDDTATFDGYTIGQVVKALRNFGLLA